MQRCRILFVCHGHPRFQIGGAEIYAYNLFDAFRRREDFEAILLARTLESGHQRWAGSPFRGVEGCSDEILWFPAEYDDFLMTLPDKRQYFVHFRDLLGTLRPDVIHVQHSSGLGLGLVQTARRVLPRIPILYTLHEFLPICRAEGLMIKTTGDALCEAAGPVECHGCFPAIGAAEFFLREKLVKAHLEDVDLFLCPSRFLLERYVEWGIPRAKLCFLENGCAQRPVEIDDADPPPNSSFGFFGQMSRHKGVLVLLEAVKILLDSRLEDFHVYLNGGNIEQQPTVFRTRVAELLQTCRNNVTVLGRYQSEDLRDRMREVAWVVMPSIWWENSPLVIQEAFSHRRPVICSDIGGMAEKVKHNVDGLHFSMGNPASLAQTMRKAATSPDLWRRLQASVPKPYSLTEAVDAHAEIYRTLVRDPEPARAV